MATTSVESWSKMKETRIRLEKCWKIDINWSLYPEWLKEVSIPAVLQDITVIIVSINCRVVKRLELQ